MQPSMGILNSPSSRIVKDSTPSRRRILRYINFIFGHGESSPNNIWSMANLEWTCILLFYYFLCLKVNLDLEKKQISLVNLHPTFFFTAVNLDPLVKEKKVNWQWILTKRFCWKGEQRWRLEVGRFKMPFDACIRFTYCDIVLYYRSQQFFLKQSLIDLL